jgi:hypothetical protein
MSMLIFIPLGYYQSSVVASPEVRKSTYLEERDNTSKNAFSIAKHQKTTRIGIVAMEISMGNQRN